MMGHDIITVGASAGGVDALRKLVGMLPRDLPASLFVAMHIGSGPSYLPQILQKVSRLAVRNPEDQEKIAHATIYVAPPDHHILLEGNVVRVVRGPKENRHRPAIDPLFRSAAVEY